VIAGRELAARTIGRQFPVSCALYDGRMSVIRTIVRGMLLALLAMAAAWAVVEGLARQLT
jgi:hypothetical protein